MGNYKGCSFTGHRRIEPRHRGLTELLDKAIAYAYSQDCRDFYIGGALGFDTFAARRTLAFRTFHPDVMVHLILPCKNQTEGWSESDRVIYDVILEAADTVEYIAETYYDGCMKKRNQRLVELCDIMIAYMGRARSGAGQTVRLAKEAGKTVYNLYPRLEAEG